MDIPRFESHRLLRGGHLQTIAAGLWPAAPIEASAEDTSALRCATETIGLPDGDRLVVRDDCPAGWPDDGQLVLMSHGLGGSDRSPYLVRLARRLHERGVRTWRINLRGFGASAPHCSRPGHAGRSEDWRAVVETALARHPQATLAAVGFSMGGNIVLKLLAEWGASTPDRLRAAAVVAPPIDIHRCAENMKRGLNRLYTQKFLRRLMRSIRVQRRQHPEVAALRLHPRPMHIMEFDDRFTAPLSGFRGALDYYRRSSSKPILGAVQVPCLVLAAADDPVIPVSIFDDAPFSPTTRFHVAEGGGHVGFFARPGVDPDRYWLDWRLLDWLAWNGIGAAVGG